MAVAFSGFGGWFGQSGNSISPNLPPGVTAGDLLVMLVTTVSSETHNTPSGWSLVSSIANGASTGPALSIFKRTAGSSEPASYAVGVSGNNQLGQAAIIRYTGNSVDCDAFGTNSGIGSSIIGPAITPTKTPSDLLLVSTFIANTYPQSHTATPAGMAKRTDSGYYGLTSALFDQSISGTTSTSTRSTVASIAAPWVTTMLNLFEGTGPTPSSAHGTLTASTVNTTTISNYNSVEIVNRTGDAEIFFTIDGTNPTVEGSGTYVLPATICSITVPCTGAAAVKLISLGTPSFSVIKQS